MRVVAVTPAGRERYLRVLMPYIERMRGIVDEHQFWVNTCDPEDVAYIESVVRSDPGFYSAQHLADPKPDWHGNRRVRLIREFFPACAEPGTVYVRFDDDICWIHPGAMQRLLDFRLDNPQYFLVYPAIINNGRTAYLHQVMGKLPENLGEPNWTKSFDGYLLTGRNPDIARVIHEHFLHYLANGRCDELTFGRYVLSNYEQVSINCISWLGSDFAQFGGVVADESCDFLEENWLTMIKPKELGRPNCIYGQSLVAHYAFHTQREHLESQTNLLDIYELLSLCGGGVPNFPEELGGLATMPLHGL
jgi:hypothetical protein